jgi:hypothetical protein
MEFEMSSTDVDSAARLRERLAHVLEPRMRLTLVREWLTACEPEVACELLIELVDAPVIPNTVQDPLRESAIALLGLADEAREPGDIEPLSYSFRSRIYAEASRLGAVALTRLLRSPPASEALENENVRLPKELSEIPLGTRRSLAKGDDKNLLDGLVRDPDQMVIENLLRNPRLLERDVVRIAALRPVTASTLDAVARSTRWSHLPRVRVALARNPYCPVEIAMRMIGTLPLPDLRDMCRDPDLHPEVLSQAQAEFERRRP